MNYDELEAQIGDLGGEEQPQAPKKLKYKSSYGQKDDLTSSEKDDLNDFLKRNKKVREKNEESSTPITEGWIPVDKEELGIRALFYPESWQFYIRPATTAAIKNWTAIDEERPDQVNQVMNEIVKATVKIETNSDTGAGWAQINSWDRFWFILKAREYTFSQGESKVEFEDACSECDSDITYTLTSNGLFYEFPDEDLVDKYWVDGVWKIDPSEYDMDHDPIILFTPKLGKDEAIIEWASMKVRNKQKIDETFIKFLAWMLPKPIKDMQLLDRQINKLYKEYKSWDIDMFTFMNDVINNITINPSEKLKCTCPHCSQEAISTVQFPNGIKTLFEVKSKAKKFGSR